jgi:hypothetical protein
VAVTVATVATLVATVAQVAVAQAVAVLVKQTKVLLVGHQIHMAVLDVEVRVHCLELILVQTVLMVVVVLPQQFRAVQFITAVAVAVQVTLVVPQSVLVAQAVVEMVDSIMVVTVLPIKVLAEAVVDLGVIVAAQVAQVLSLLTQVLQPHQLQARQVLAELFIHSTQAEALLSNGTLCKNK